MISIWTHCNFLMQFNAFLHLHNKHRQMYFNMKNILNTSNLTSKQVCKCNIGTTRTTLMLEKTYLSNGTVNQFLLACGKLSCYFVLSLSPVICEMKSSQIKVGLQYISWIFFIYLKLTSTSYIWNCAGVENGAPSCSGTMGLCNLIWLGWTSFS